jgi:hypothetical protein
MPDFQKVMHVIRNAEEGASDDAIRSLIIYKLFCRMVCHYHTDCEWRLLQMILSEIYYLLAGDRCKWMEKYY